MMREKDSDSELTANFEQTLRGQLEHYYSKTPEAKQIIVHGCFGACELVSPTSFYLLDGEDPQNPAAKVVVNKGDVTFQVHALPLGKLSSRPKEAIMASGTMLNDLPGFVESLLGENGDDSTVVHGETNVTFALFLKELGFKICPLGWREAIKTNRYPAAMNGAEYSRALESMREDQVVEEITVFTRLGDLRRLAAALVAGDESQSLGELISRIKDKTTPELLNKARAMAYANLSEHPAFDVRGASFWERFKAQFRF